MQITGPHVASTHFAPQMHSYASWQAAPRQVPSASRPEDCRDSRNLRGRCGRPTRPTISMILIFSLFLGRPTRRPSGPSERPPARAPALALQIEIKLPQQAAPKAPRTPRIWARPARRNRSPGKPFNPARLAARGAGRTRTCAGPCRLVLAPEESLRLSGRRRQPASERSNLDDNFGPTAPPEEWGLATAPAARHLVVAETTKLNAQTRPRRRAPGCERAPNWRRSAGRSFK